MLSTTQDINKQTNGSLWLLIPIVRMNVIQSIDCATKSYRSSNSRSYSSTAIIIDRNENEETA